MATKQTTLPATDGSSITVAPFDTPRTVKQDNMSRAQEVVALNTSERSTLDAAYDLYGSGITAKSTPSAPSGTKTASKAQKKSEKSTKQKKAIVAQGSSIPNTTLTAKDVDIIRSTAATEARRQTASEAASGLSSTASDESETYRSGGTDSWGIEPKEDQVSMLRFVSRTKGDGNEIRYIDLLPPLTRFMVEGVTEAHDENFQVSINNLNWDLYAFGEKPRFETISGQLLNTANFKWRAQFMAYYTAFLRADRCANIRAEVLFSFDHRIWRGALVNARSSLISTTPYTVPLQFTMAVFQDYDQEAADETTLLQNYFNGQSANNAITDTQRKAIQDAIDELAANAGVFRGIENTVVQYNIRREEENIASA